MLFANRYNLPTLFEFKHLGARLSRSYRSANKGVDIKEDSETLENLTRSINTLFGDAFPTYQYLEQRADRFVQNDVYQGLHYVNQKFLRIVLGRMFPNHGIVDGLERILNISPTTSVDVSFLHGLEHKKFLLAAFLAAVGSFAHGSAIRLDAVVSADSSPPALQ